jgi:hypothetical protein
MRLGALVTPMVIPKSLLKIAESFIPLAPRLPFPKHHKTLATNAAMRFSVSRRALAKNLHLFLRQCVLRCDELKPTLPNNEHP